MPSLAVDGPIHSSLASPSSPGDVPTRKSHEKTVSGVFAFTNGTTADPSNSEPRKNPRRSSKNTSLYSLPNGTPSASHKGGWEHEHEHPQTGSICSMSNGSVHHVVGEVRSPGSIDDNPRRSSGDYFGKAQANVVPPTSTRPPDSEQSNVENEQTSAQDHTWDHVDGAAGQTEGAEIQHEDDAALKSQPDGVPLDRFSTPAAMSTGAQSKRLSPHPPNSIENPRPAHRHTLQVPKPTPLRPSRDFSFTGGPSEEALSATGRFSPTHGDGVHRRRASVGLIRRPTRSMQSDTRLDEVVPDEDALRWTEAIRQKRASRRRRKDEEDDDRVVVGTKVDQNHVNWVTAYNMLTGIRFTVSRTNAKIDRELTDADFTARHKFSFDITGNELTPSAKYDFKFKDYSPWVFRHLRSIFGLDPADYLMSLTSKYILSELGSPGKSGSFFYFSRDYKYIIKTIHHAEHKLLRKVLHEYYKHVVANPNTLISQFYGLHRVKIPYGRKIHFVVMNNLFPPHRDIHQMFDLKGSTIGREFKEEALATNPRATLKDLNWLRRDLHLQFDPPMKELFVEQMRRDVKLLQRLHIMDYSLLVGIHDLDKGNEENVREATLRVFQPGGERQQEDGGSNMLTRTPSRLENARKARELRLTLKKEKPVPMGLVSAKMPDELLADERKDRVFYSDDGGVRASHENGSPGDEVYYLGIIDCLTHYGFVKRVEHLWKGISHDRTQISAVEPESYGDRFVNFMTGITMTKEEAERRKHEEGQPVDEHEAGIRAQQRGDPQLSFDGSRSSREVAKRAPRSPTVDRTMQKAQHQADKSEKQRSSHEEPPDRTLATTQSPSPDFGHSAHGTTLPIVEEVGEAGSTGGRSGSSTRPAEGEGDYQGHSSHTNLPNGRERPEPFQPGDEGTVNNSSQSRSWGEEPILGPVLSSSPPSMDFENGAVDSISTKVASGIRHTR